MRRIHRGLAVGVRQEWRKRYGGQRAEDRS